MTPKQQLFVQEYLVDLNAKEAAIRAGYSERSAAQRGHVLIHDPEIAAAIAEAQGVRVERTQVSQDQVVAELAAIAFADIRDLFDEFSGALLPLSDLPADLTRAIASIEVEDLFEGRGEDRYQTGFLRKIKRWDKLKALELLGKHIGMWPNKVALENPDGSPLQIEVVKFGSGEK